MSTAPPITLYQFPLVWGRNVSPFTLKLETWLKLTGIPYETVAVRNPGKGPKGKLPYIRDGDVVIGDSGLIIEHLKRTRGVDLDAGLDPLERADALAFQRLLEDHLYFILAYSRWIDPDGWRATAPALFGSIPPGPRQIVAAMIRRRVTRDLKGQGVGRHSRDELYAMGQNDLEALATRLDGGPFFLRDRPSTLDAVAYGFLANLLLVPVETKLKEIGLGFPNLRAFCLSMERYLAEREATAEVDVATAEAD